MAISAYQMSEIQRKAGLGERMQIDTPEKIALYNHYAGDSANNPYAVKKEPAFDIDAFSNTLGGHLNAFNENFTNQFSQMQGMYDTRMSALEKMLTDMQNKNKYLGVQGTQQLGHTTGQGMGDGQHIFQPSEKQAGDGAGYTQGENASNQALFKYLQNMWNGGF